METRDPIVLSHTGAVAEARLNVPETLNAITTPMVRSLHATLDSWSRSPTVAVVILSGTGEKAFCAGGDVVAIHQALLHDNPRAAMDFFREEYALDECLHRFPKPILCIADRIVMGGGMGLMNGCSHRVVTERSVLAMPEITIGFFPDVGGSYFLSRIPHGLGIFLALTACRIGAADAIFTGLADAFVESATISFLLDKVRNQHWSDNGDDNHALLTSLIQAHSARPGPGEIEARLHTLEAMTDCETIDELEQEWRSMKTQDPWLQKALATFAAGSPTSAAVIFEQVRRGRQLSLCEAFAQDLRIAQGFVKHPDFREGVRALLVDKDRNPRWSPPTQSQIKYEQVQKAFFE